MEYLLALNSRYRERITPTRSVKVKETTTDEESDGREELDQTVGKRKGMCRAQRLRRVFNRAAQVGRLGIDVSICSACGGPMRIIVGMPNRSIEDRFVIDKILFHLAGRWGTGASDSSPPGARAPPPAVC